MLLAWILLVHSICRCQRETVHLKSTQHHRTHKRENIPGKASKTAKTHVCRSTSVWCGSCAMVGYIYGYVLTHQHTVQSPLVWARMTESIVEQCLL
uniref:Secreted protein n=1 Tax=Amphilophus citrinellus TaxID=61819 RepID=A0A3Q0RKT8_AMPCI